MTTKKIHPFLLILLFVTTADYVYALKSPADNYSEQLESHVNTPADNYYEQKLRASGPEPGNPGGPPGIDDGSGSEIDGDFVGGVPIGDASIFHIVLIGINLFIYKKYFKKRQSKI